MSEEQVAEVSAEPEVTQSVADDWRSSIPEEIRGHRSLESIKDVGSLAKSYVNAQSMIGADKVAIPGRHATDDDWVPVWDKLGRPEAPEGYELENTPGEGIEPNADMLNWFKGAAHNAGLTPGQAQKLLNDYNGMIAESGQVDSGQAEQLTQATETELRREYGQAFDDRMGNANAVLANFGQQEMTEIELADGRLLGDHPEMIRMMVNIGEFLEQRIGEDSLEGISSPNAMTPTDAMHKLSELRAPGSPYWDNKHPQHQFYVEESLRYQEMAST